MRLLFYFIISLIVAGCLGSGFGFGFGSGSGSGSGSGFWSSDDLYEKELIRSVRNKYNSGSFSSLSLRFDNELASIKTLISNDYVLDTRFFDILLSSSALYSEALAGLESLFSSDISITNIEGTVYFDEYPAFHNIDKLVLHSLYKQKLLVFFLKVMLEMSKYKKYKGLSFNESLDLFCGRNATSNYCIYVFNSLFNGSENFSYDKKSLDVLIEFMKSNSKLSESFNRIQRIACINNPRHLRSQCDPIRNLDSDVYHLELFVNKFLSNIESVQKKIKVDPRDNYPKQYRAVCQIRFAYFYPDPDSGAYVDPYKLVGFLLNFREFKMKINPSSEGSLNILVEDAVLGNKLRLDPNFTYDTFVEILTQSFSLFSTNNKSCNDQSSDIESLDN